MLRTRLLMVQEDADFAEMMTWQLERQDFEVATAPDGEEALRLVSKYDPELILLDWMSEGLSGIELCKRLRENPSTKEIPVIMLTARRQEQDRVKGLEAGADDYVTKPVSPRELVARCRAVLRRVKAAASPVVLTYADLQMDVDNYRVKRRGKTLSLGPREFQLLRHFMENPGRLFPRERLLSAVWGHDSDVGPRTVDVHIRRLRLILNKHGGADLIRTVRSGGYALDMEA